VDLSDSLMVSVPLQVDAMLHNLEKELDDVDAKIGDRWRILDRYWSTQ
jgi:LETM1 and EF-hand domain-containing protein 1